MDEKGGYGFERWGLMDNLIYEVHGKEQTSFVRRDCVLEIIDSYKYSLCWSISEKLWNENLDKIKAEVLELKGR